MNSKLFTALGLTSAFSINIYAEAIPQNQTDSKTQKDQPNILMIMADDLVQALNSKGMEYTITPNIDYNE